MLLLRIDHRSREPIYRQIVRQISELVQADALKAGDHLPPTRVLAQELGISRFTVAQAYEQLWASGYTESQQGSRTQIRARPKQADCVTRGQQPSPGSFHWSRAAEALRARYERVLRRVPPEKDWIDFAPLTLDPKIFPLSDLRRQFAWALREKQAPLLNYAEPAGYMPLRQYVASRMKRHGVEIHPDQVLITHGSLQGLALIVRLLVDPEQTVAIEQPTYPAAMSVLRAHGAKLVGIPMLSDGMDLDVLERALKARNIQRRPVLIYSIPTYQNPTGITTQQPHRERLLSLCAEHQVPLVEDGFQEEITFFGRVVSPIKSMDREGLVFYLGSFSKVFVPGLRIGWIAAAREAITELARLKQVEDVSCSPFVQAALSRFCASGAYEVHLRRMNRVFSGRLRRTLEAVEKHLPLGKLRFVAPTGGYLLWLQLEGLTVSEPDLMAALHRHRVSAAPASWFYSKEPGQLGLRLSISSLEGDQIEEGILRLGRALDERYRTGERAGGEDKPRKTTGRRSARGT